MMVRSELEGFYDELAGIVPPDALTDMERLALLAGLGVAAAAATFFVVMSIKKFVKKIR
jgi:hypothetical protein